RSISFCGIAPMNILTGWPSRNATTVGMLCDRTACRSALPTPWASTSILARVNAPSRLVAASSSIGPRVRHGPHQEAQRSTTTGAVLDPSTTTCSKVSSVTSITCSIGSMLRDLPRYEPPEAKGVGHDADAGGRHRGGRPHRLDQPEHRERDHHDVV